MIKRIAISSILLGTFIISGCSGLNYTEDELSDLLIGKTQREVVELIGSPTREYSARWFYHYKKKVLWNPITEKYRSFYVRFYNDGTVHSIES